MGRVVNGTSGLVSFRDGMRQGFRCPFIVQLELSMNVCVCVSVAIRVIKGVNSVSLSGGGSWLLAVKQLTFVDAQHRLVVSPWR